MSLLLLMIYGVPLCACLWVTGTTEDGKQTSVSGFGPAKRLLMRMRTNMPERGANMETRVSGLTDATNRNDLAVALVYQGQYQEAIEMLQQQEREHPGEYFTAANLGTALELAGRNDEAFKWITEGIRRNTNSHHGTEWLHARILAAKIEAARNPDYFKLHSVLDLDYSQVYRGATLLTVGGQQRGLPDVENALLYQLEERLQFVKTNDPPVASLLFDYAVITAATHNLEAAKDLLNMAVTFGYPRDKVQPLLAKYDHIIVMASVRQWTIYISVGLCFVAFVIYAVKRGWIVYRKSSVRI